MVKQQLLGRTHFYAAIVRLFKPTFDEQKQNKLLLFENRSMSVYRGFTPTSI